MKNWTVFLRAASIGAHLLTNVAPAFAYETGAAMARPNAQFAREYSADMLQIYDDRMNDFVRRVIKSEGKFHQDGIAYNAESGLTYDGHPIDFNTGQLREKPHNWSAPSKESLHLNLLALVLDGNEYAQLFVSPSNPAKAKEKALNLLQRKMASYEKFSQEYPGFGGFLPWFQVSNAGLRPTSDWSNRVPALDNGQFAWSLYLTADILEKNGYSELANRYKVYWTTLAENSVPMFLDTRSGRVRGISQIQNVKGGVTKQNYATPASPYYLTDSYEGEMMVLFMSLFGRWPSAEDRNWVWKDKRMSKATYRTQFGRNITVRQGFWYSVQEVWNFLALPYNDVPLAKRIFTNGEKARSWYSAEHKIPGLMASVNAPVSGNVNGGYISNLGVPGLAQEKNLRNDVVAPYAAFPMILANMKAGVVWYWSMLRGPKMQGPYGATESISTDGKRIAPMLTWDGKVLPILALAGESSDRMREALKRSEKYKEFIRLVENEYSETFGNSQIEGEDLPFQTPGTELPKNIPDFDRLDTFHTVELLNSSQFQGGGQLYAEHRRRNELLALTQARGFVWTACAPTDISKNHFVNFEVKTQMGIKRKNLGLYLEVKNSEDKLITTQKIRLEFPETSGKFRTFSIDIEPFIGRGNTKASVVAFSDSEMYVEFKSVTLASEPSQGSEVLSYDGRQFLSDGETRQALNRSGYEYQN